MTTRMPVDKDKGNLLRVIADELNELIGNPVCAVVCEHGGSCTLPTDHDGDHKAEGFDDEVHCTW